VSSRFRKQLAFVLIDIHLKCWRKRANQHHINQIVPQALEINEIP
jgi:hypothetical protein